MMNMENMQRSGCSEGLRVHGEIIAHVRTLLPLSL